MCSTSAVPTPTETPKTFYTLYEKATEAFRNGNLEDCVSLNAEALSMTDSTPDLNWKDVSAVQLNQSHILKLVGDIEGARKIAEEALRSLDAHFSSSKAEVCHALDVLGELCVELGDKAVAREYVDRSIDVKNRLYGVHGLPLAKSYNIRGALNLQTDNLAQSRSDFIRALGINVRHYGRSTPLALPIAVTLSNIAGVLRKDTSENRLSDCIQIYRAVVSSFESAGDDSAWMVGNACTDLAECLIDSQCELEEAKSLLTRALQIFLASRGIEHASTLRAASLLKALSTQTTSFMQSTPSSFVETLLNECEAMIPKKADKIAGDIIFLDRRGHVGFGHPHTPLI
jgi:tetratricopeptide (TPR) repeat protein